MISSVTKLGATALFAGVLLSSAIPASASTCQRIYASGAGGDEEQAMANTYVNWQRNAEARLGSYFHGSGYSGNCRQNGELWHCRYMAPACVKGNLEDDLAKHGAKG
jgi:hypothetical protein